MIKQIEIRKFLLKQYDNSSIDYQVIINNSSEADGLVHFTFEPKMKFKKDSFSNIGIYKKRKVTK